MMKGLVLYFKLLMRIFRILYIFDSQDLNTHIPASFIIKRLVLVLFSTKFYVEYGFGNNPFYMETLKFYACFKK